MRVSTAVDVVPILAELEFDAADDDKKIERAKDGDNAGRINECTSSPWNFGAVRPRRICRGCR